MYSLILCSMACKCGIQTIVDDCNTSTSIDVIKLIKETSRTTEYASHEKDDGLYGTNVGPKIAITIIIAEQANSKVLQNWRWHPKRKFKTSAVQISQENQIFQRDKSN